MAMLFSDPFESLFNLQKALDAFHASGWLEPGPSAGGTYPPLNVFRKDDDAVVIIELPGVKKTDVDIQAKGSTIRISGTRTIEFPQKAGIHRRERIAGRFDRAITIPFEVNVEEVKAEYRDGILALFLPRAEQDKPRSIKLP
ncbi:Hsp20/alpha crystallin family protein [Vineibacter terrae]|nr:Hsp20/alpha crystallin family protein [Vineibacter terrae]HEX2888326.1 Hsp20/alpha crystallin family protein [Vineibacter terrae]